ncbi:MAG TPA: hypothetical protein VJ724_05440 [Tahibacter sp.]|nr:hypothetical protein [Tahibacter sp.]
MIDAEAMYDVLRDERRLKRHAELVIGTGSIAARIRDSALGEPLAALAAQLPAADDTQPLLEAIGDLFTDEFLLALLRRELENFSESDLYTLPAAVIESETLSGVLLYADRDVTVTLSAFSPADVALRRHARASGAATKKVGITMSAVDASMRFIRAGRTTMRLWSGDLIGFDTPLSGDIACADGQTRDIGPGSRVFVRGGRQSWTFDSADEPVLMLLVAAKRLNSPVNAQYDSTTRRLACVSAADDKSSRVQILSTFLRSMRPDVARDVLPTALAHRDHFVRWHVMRELVASDAQTARPHLERMRETDPHAQVARAAAATIALYED